MCICLSLNKWALVGGRLLTITILYDCIHILGSWFKSRITLDFFFCQGPRGHQWYSAAEIDLQIWKNTPPKLTWQWKKQPFEDVSPINNGDFPMSFMLVFRGVTLKRYQHPKEKGSVLFRFCYECPPPKHHKNVCAPRGLEVTFKTPIKAYCSNGKAVGFWRAADLTPHGIHFHICHGHSKWHK